MAEKKFKFVSPGIFVDEIDDSGIPNSGGDIGPVIVGRSTRGPGMRPTRIESFSEFVQTFGAPTPGNDTEKDVWRSNNPAGPTYAAYGAQAWLKNNRPLTFVRLMGEEHPSAATAGKAGFKTTNTFNNTNSSNGGAYGLFLINSSSIQGDQQSSPGNFPTGTLAAIWYLQAGAMALTGNVPVGALGGDDDVIATVAHSSPTASVGGFIQNAASNEWTIILNDGTDTDAGAGTCTGKKYTFNFDRNSSKFIRTVFNTNPVLTNSNIASTQQKYWLGETFEGSVAKYITSGSGAGTVFGFIAGLGTSDTVGHHHRQMPAQPSKTGWFISQDSRATYTDYTADGTTYVKQLFRFVSLDDGEWSQSNLKISIADIKAPRNSYEKYGSFSVLVRDIRDSDNAPGIVEKFTNLNLNPSSENFISKRIGDQHLVWDSELSVPGGVARYKMRGDYPNVSRFFRVELNDEVKLGLDTPELLPFGVRGPMRYKGWSFKGRDIQAYQINQKTSVAAAAASVVFQFSDNSSDETTFTFTDALGTSATFEVDRVAADGASVAGAIAMSGYANSGTGLATALETALDASDLRIDTTRSTAKLTLTMQDAGASGNTPIVTAGGVVNVDDSSQGDAMPTQFEGGSDTMGPAHTAATLFLETDPGVVPYKHGIHKGDVDGAGNACAPHAAGKNPIAPHSIPAHSASAAAYSAVPRQALSGAFVFPTISMRSSSLDGNLKDRTDAFFGATFNRLGEATKSNLFDESSIDVVRALAATYSKNSWDPPAEATAVEHAWTFTLDDLQKATSSDFLAAAYVSGSRVSGESFTAASGSYREVLNNGYDRFTAALYGGFNGLDVTEAEPFGNHRLDDSTNVKENYSYYSVKKAIDAIADSESAEMDLLVAPGITNPSITEHMINVCENRGDALAIIDIESDYIPRYESNSAEASRIGTVVSAVNTFKDRGLNSSYGCAFYPWVQVRDSASETFPGKLVWMPPSVAALGTFSSTQRNAELWFAPAGFNRGGLSEGVSGLNVVNVRQRLTSVDRDRLYGANINPIAKFPSEGIVVFGQKTLQVTPSALDRINVRRLLIFLKKRISRISASILFEPNVQTTWDRFLGRVNPLLESVKARFGLVDFKVVLDSSTTTDDLIDQNILYAKVFLKPTKAIEFIALDFVITNTGASFED